MEKLDPLVAKILPPKLSKGEKKKIQILKGTLELIGKEGAESLNYNAIGKAIGESRALVAHHYPDKKQLLIQCCQIIVLEVQEKTIKQIENAKNRKSVLKAFIDPAVDIFYENPGYSSIFLLLYHYCIVDKEVNAFHIQFLDMGATRMAEALAPFFSESLNDKTKLEKARDIQSIIRGWTIDHSLRPTPLSKKRLKNKILELIETHIEF